MSCHTCGQSPCNCATVTCDSSCTDPGVVAYGSHVSVLNQQLCDKRLSSPEENSVLTAVVTGSGSIQVRWSNSPCYLPDELQIADGVAFNGLTANMGDAGCQRRLNPEAGATGWLTTDGNGNWVLAQLPTTNVPDPLELGTLTVTGTSTLNDVSIANGGSFCFPGMSSGTVVSPVGLNADGCLVKQTSGSSSPLTASGAVYYEQTSETGVETPNNTIADGQNAIIGNELYDPDDVSGVTNQTTITIKIAGQYMIQWQGYVEPQASARYVGLNLSINGVLAAYGANYANTSGATPPRTPMIQGMTMRTLAANDTISLPVESSNGGAGLRRVKLVLLKFAAS